MGVEVTAGLEVTVDFKAAREVTAASEVMESLTVGLAVTDSAIAPTATGSVTTVSVVPCSGLDPRSFGTTRRTMSIGPSGIGITARVRVPITRLSVRARSG
jgi:hypothetical protein